MEISSVFQKLIRIDVLRCVFDGILTQSYQHQTIFKIWNNLKNMDLFKVFQLTETKEN